MEIMLEMNRPANRIFLSLFVIAICTGAPVALAADDVASLQAAFLKGEYGSVLRGAAALEKRGAGERDTLLYLQGVSAFKLSEWDVARARLNRLISEYPRSRWRAQAWLALGDALESSGQGEEALKAYQQVYRESGGEALFPQATLRTGKILLRMGHWGESKQVLESLISRVPNSEEAAAAKELLHGGDFYYCVQTGAFVNQANAMKLAEELRRRGYPAELQEGTMQGKLFYRVRIGRYAKRAEAEEQAKRLQEDGFPARIFP